MLALEPPIIGKMAALFIKYPFPMVLFNAFPIIFDHVCNGVHTIVAAVTSTVPLCNTER